jgi:molybdopterin-guanine dinucleotide biosynthesis protein MobB
MSFGDYPLPVLAFYGKSNSGKTTLVERVIAGLTQRGAQVASVKGHMHELEFDVRGKDSWRHAQAGAAVSMLATPNGWMAVHKTRQRVALEVLAQEAKRCGCDVLVVEGYKDADVPSIEVTVENRDTLDVGSIVEGLLRRIEAVRDEVKGAAHR